MTTRIDYIVASDEFAGALDAFFDARQSDYADFLFVAVDLGASDEPGWHRLRCTIKRSDGVIDATHRGMYVGSNDASDIAHALDTARALANRD